MNNLKIINKFLLDNNNGILFISNISEEISIFYKMLIQKLSKSLYSRLIPVTKMSELLFDQNSSLFNERELYFCELSGTKLLSENLIKLSSIKKIFILVPYGIFKKESHNFLAINSYDYKKDIDAYFKNFIKDTKVSEKSRDTLLSNCYDNPHLFFSELSKYELNQDLTKNRKTSEYKNSIQSIRQDFYKIKNNFSIQNLPLLYKNIKDEIKVKKFNF